MGYYCRDECTKLNDVYYGPSGEGVRFVPRFYCPICGYYIRQDSPNIWRRKYCVCCHAQMRRHARVGKLRVKMRERLKQVAARI